jgi:hypothetical protein
VNKIRGERTAGARISAEQISNLIDHGAVAEVNQWQVGLNVSEEAVFRNLADNYGRLPVKDVFEVTFTRDGYCR